MNRKRARAVRQMPRIYGNLQKPKRDYGPLFARLRTAAWLVGGAALCYVIFFGTVFTVRRVEVRGVELSDAEQIKAQVPLGVSLWRVPEVSIQRHILATQPVVRVRILKGLPDSIRVVVEEEKPVVLWESAGVASLLNEEGVAFAQYRLDSPPQPDSALGQRVATLPRVVDKQNVPVELGKAIAGHTFIQFVQSARRELETHLPERQWSQAEIDATLYDITFVTSDGLRVLFNTLSASDVQVRNLTRLVQQGKVGLTGSVDLRIDRWAYVKDI